MSAHLHGPDCLPFFRAPREQVEEYHRVDSEIGARYHRWSFGKSLQRGDLRGGYVMKVGLRQEGVGVEHLVGAVGASIVHLAPAQPAS